jgi:hypothetical protein
LRMIGSQSANLPIALPEKPTFLGSHKNQV